MHESAVMISAMGSSDPWVSRRCRLDAMTRALRDDMTDLADRIARAIADEMPRSWQ